MTDHTNKAPAFAPTISIGTRQLEDGSFGATLTVTGLASKAQADAACAHLQKLFCGNEIKAQ